MPTRFYSFVYGDDGAAVRDENGRAVRIHQISCTGCSRTLYTTDPTNPRAHACHSNGLELYESVADVFRWSNSRQSWIARCRECARQVRRARREAAATPSPRNTRVTFSDFTINTGVNITSDPATATTPTPPRAAPINGDRKFGVELECRFPVEVRAAHIERRLNAEGLHRWQIKGDGSIRGHGYEIVSPPLSGDVGFDQLTTVCRILKDLGATVDSSCGTHVHHEIRDLELPAIKRFARTWANNQHIIDGLVSASRRGRHTFADAFTDYDAEAIEAVEDARYLYSAIGTRYKALNFSSFGRFGTVEVRQHQGTLDAEKIRSWTKLAQGMLAACAASTEPVPRQSTVMSMLSCLGNALDGTARTFLLGRAVQFNHVQVV